MQKSLGLAEMIVFQSEFETEASMATCKESNLLSLYTLDLAKEKVLEGTGRGVRERLVTCIFSFVTFVISPAVVLWPSRVRFALSVFMA